MNKFFRQIKKSVEMPVKASLLFVLFILSACTQDERTGMSVLRGDDQILVCTDTFRLVTDMIQAQSIPSDPDSVLLGETDNQLGTLHADFITQLTCPEGFEFPQNAVLDSATLTLYYRNWYGDGNSPLAINVYQLDLGTFDYDSVYYTDIDILEYCSFNDSTAAVEQPRIITAATPTDSFSTSSTTYNLIKFKLTERVMRSLFNNGKYASQEDFNKAFKGFYITTEYGSASVLYIENMAVSLHYHFDYQIEGRDTTTKDNIDFYATDEVRCINRILYLHPDDYAEQLFADSTISYISSPANIYTTLNIPIRQMVANVKDSLLSGKRPYVNSAKIKIYATNYTTTIDPYDVSQWAQPPSYMLMITADKIVDFFYSRSLPNDSTAMLGSLTTETDSLDNVHAYYTYDISSILTQAMRNKVESDTLYMVLVPVAVESQTSSTYNTTTVTSVRPLQAITNTVINTEYNEDFPLRLSVVATGL